MLDEQFPVSRHDLADLLSTFRERRGETVEVVEGRLAAAQYPGAGLAVAPGRIAALERKATGAVTLTDADWRLLSLAYLIPTLMLDPLRVPALDTPCLLQRRDELVPLGKGAGTEYGDRARYYAPGEKRKGTEEAAFVLLELAPNGRSQVHAHPGDELLLVLEGAVEARLETSGLTVRLAAGDHLFFYAEQRHGLRNPGARTARVFVIRFYQLARAGARAELLHQLRLTKRKGAVTARAVDEMIALLTPTDLREEDMTAGEVRDRGGLGRLLQLLAAEKFRRADGALTVRALADRLTKRGLDFTHSKVNRMHHGQAPVPVADLARVAAAYDAEPLLLYEFRYPALRPAIAVQHNVDYRDVPPELLGGSGGRYRVPCRRLADSDLGVAWLSLPAGMSTPRKRHPGHELLLPIRGRARVRIGQLAVDITAGEHLFAHYSSEEAHEVSNIGGEEAELFVVRFYE